MSEQSSMESTSAVVRHETPTLVAEVWRFLRVRKKFWLAPIIVVLMLLGTLMAVATGSGVLAPFIYMGI